MSTAFLVVADTDLTTLEIDPVTAVQQVRPHLIHHCLDSTASTSGVVPAQISVVSVSELSTQFSEQSSSATDALILPLTMNLPNECVGITSTIYALCRDVAEMRQRVTQLGYLTGQGDYWLPIVLTAKGPLFGEVVGPEPAATSEATPPTYYQPIHLADRQRQPLYHLGQQLLQSLSAPPATYMLQFGWQEQRPRFDRLWPFPIKPALASLAQQSPDLLVCHWRCCLGLPITDLLIADNSAI